MRPKLPICTSGRCLCNEHRRMPAGTPRRRPAGTFRHPGSDIGEPAGVPPPAPPPCRQPGPPCPEHHRRRQRDGAGCRARQPLPRGQRRRATGRAAGRARACRSRALSLGGTGPGPVTQTATPGRTARRRRGTGANQAAAQSGWLHRRAARPALHRPAVVLEEPRAMGLGRLVPAAAYRMRRSGSEWSRSGKSLPLTVTSPDLARGTFPREFTCDGANRPPRLQWSTPPSGTQELAVEMLDPDAPGGTFTHWLIYRMPLASPAWPTCRPAPRKASTTSPARLRGPMPAARRRASLPLRGPHAGHPAGPGSRARRSDLDSGISGHALGRGELVATYRRP